MRRTIIYSLCCASLLLSSCDLDVPVTDRLPDEEVWKDDNLITGVFSRLYNQMQMEHNSTYFEGWDVWNVSLVTASDEGTGAYQAGDLGTGDVARANFNDEWFGLWEDGFKAVRATNLVLQELNAAEMPESKRQQLIAEARFIRAFHYFNLVKRYGGVPIVTEVQQYTGPEDLYGLQVSRDKEQEVWDFILTELDESALELPETRESVERTRATRYAAYALQSRAALYAASIAKYGKVQLNAIVGVNSDDANAYWAKSIEAADKVINSGKYTLYNQYADRVENFRNMFLEKRGCSEFIFWKEFLATDLGHSWDLLNVPFSFVQNGYGCGQNPTLDLIEAFEYKDGSDGTLKLKDASGNYIKYDSPLDLFKDKDPRLRATFYLPMDECRGGIVEIRRGIYDASKSGDARFITSNNVNEYYGEEGNQMKILGKDGVWDTGDVGKTGFYTKKFSDEGVTDISGNKSDAPWPVFRLAEMYLNKAEAAMELGKTGDAATALNMVRERAGIRTLSAGEVSLDRIRNERRVELAYENHRHWDLKRWHIAHIKLADFPTMALYPWYIWGEGKYIFTTGKAPKPNKVFLERNYYIKIKDSDMGSNPMLAPNNPGF
ncbi:RagB/SusD family nutrient uptake outer membrane protein [Parabacteroides distasonis]|uniref:RagB/SusD family nutrient uptake outer membrane protein n=1 Tax=Parabacteroides distasonis TaxID=823 RepID=A0A1Y4II03_PARDI|nr:RagB/SusD family nutrient uptake outer membrane protein [Parabacteroides distasonis]OUP18610.1 RagB/SusD family nutrient uptake outer membrane protein [Parabacteroides distasonis]